MTFEFKNLETEVFYKTIYYKRWVLTDFLIVIMRSLINLGLIAPIILIMLFIEVSYSVYSSNNPFYRLQFEDFQYQVPSIDVKLTIIVILVFYFALFQYLDEFALYLRSTFPEDRSFNESTKQPTGFLFQIQYIFVLFFIGLTVSYIGLVMLWLVLGAIINPENYLVYASTVGTLVTFVKTKYNQTLDLANNGFDKIKELVLGEINQKISKVAGFIVQQAQSLSQAGQAFVQQNSKFVTDAAQKLGFGKEAEQFQGQVDSFFKETDQLNEQSLVQGVAKMHPDDIEQQMQNIKQEIIEGAKNLLINKCKQEGIPDSFIEVLINLHFNKDNEKKLREDIAAFIKLKTDGLINEKIVIWIIRLISEGKSKGQFKETVANSNLDEIIDGVLEMVISIYFKIISPEQKRDTIQMIQRLSSDSGETAIMNDPQIILPPPPQPPEQKQIQPIKQDPGNGQVDLKQIVEY